MSCADLRALMFHSVSSSSPLRWASVDGRQNHLRDVARGSVILGIAILTGTSSLFGWAASRTSRQITRRALRRSHLGSGPSLGGPGVIIAVPLSLTIYNPRQDMQPFVNAILEVILPPSGDPDAPLQTERQAKRPTSRLPLSVPVYYIPRRRRSRVSDLLDQYDEFDKLAQFD